MHIRLELARARLRFWHLWLIDHLKAKGATTVSVAFSDSECRPATALNLLLMLDSLTQAGAATASGSKVVTPDDILNAVNDASDANIDVDLVFRVGATHALLTGIPTLQLLFDDHPHEDAMWLALLDRRAPRLVLQDVSLYESGETSAQYSTASTLPALEARHTLSPSADAVMSRAIEMIGAVLDRHKRGVQPELSPTSKDLTQSTNTRAILPHTTAFLARRVMDKARATLGRITNTAPQWSVAWRGRTKQSPATAETLNVDGFLGLPDDGQRYFADPFGLDRNGVTHVFVEEFPYATGRGLISSFTIDANGCCSPPRPVLETDVHLSYPQVFEHAGDIFMLPESSQSGGLDLYRADPFPNTWVHEARLIAEPLHDATVHFDGTRWWLFAATQFLKSSSWCALQVFTADALHGPWHAIRTDPVKVDARSARPAGNLVSINDTLWRPAQDCLNGYGHGLTWCRIEALTPDHFSEQAVGHLGLAPRSKCFGPHTWNTTPSIELIDLFAAPSARPPSAYPKAT